MIIFKVMTKIIRQHRSVVSQNRYFNNHEFDRNDAEILES